MTGTEHGAPLKQYTAALAVLAFLIPGFVMLLVLRQMGFYPFGDTSLLIMDMDDQYVQFYEYLRHIAAGEGSIFFSWSKTFGSNFTGLFAYYLSSPLSVLMLLFEDAQAGVFWLTVMKTALCGLSSFFYFRSVHGCKGAPVLLFTTSYALMSYNLVYSLCPMWIDGVIWLPVVLLGAERILQGRRPWLFILALAAALVSNYYTGYMVCLFGVLYVLYRYFSAPKAERALSVPRALGRFAAAYAAALGLAMWLLLPVLFDLMAGKIGFSSYIPPQMGNFPPTMLLRSFLRGEYTSITNNGAPALYSGILMGVLCAVYFCARRVGMRAKLFTAAFFALLLCCFYFVKLDIIWHIFQYPNWFPYRYAFVFQFLAVSTACAGWKAVEVYAADIRKRKRVVAAVIPVLLLVFIGWDMYGNALGLLNGLNLQFRYKPAELYAEFRAETKPLVDAVHDMDDNFYRIEKTYKHSMNDALGLGYKGVTHYSSLFFQDILNVTKKLGMAQTYFWNGYIGSTPVTDALLDIKYVLSRTPLPYEVVVGPLNQGGAAVYENPYVLPPAFVTQERLDVSTDGWDCFARQNEIVRLLGGADVFTPIMRVIRDDSGYTFIAENNRPVYAYFPITRFQNSNDALYVNGTLIVPRYFSTDDNNAVYLGTFAPGTEVKVSFDVRPEDVPLLGEYLYTLDIEALADITERVRGGGLSRTDYTADSLHGSVDARNGGYLFISIPYDKGWTVKIDGQKAQTEKALGAFMAVPISGGEHMVDITFRPRGLAAGAMVSLLTALGLVGAWIMGKRKAG